MLLYAFIHALWALKAKVSPHEQQADRWSRVYRLFPAEAGKNALKEIRQEVSAAVHSSSPDVEELANQMKELGVSKLCATEPCSVLAKILDAETKDLENQVQFNLGRERKKGEIMPLYDDSGIYIEHEEIYEMTKKLVREKLE